MFPIVRLSLLLFFFAANAHRAVCEEEQSKPLSNSEVNSNYGNVFFAEGRASTKNLAVEPGIAPGVLQPDLFTGAMTTTFNFASVPGRGLIQPSFGLSYSSGQINGTVGVGWSLPSTSINLQKVPHAGGQLGYFFSSPSGVAKLIRTGEPNIFQTQIESDFARFELKEDQAQPYWILTDRAGTRTLLGNTANARRDLARSNTTVEWKPTEISDLKGNYARFAYECDSKNPQRSDGCIDGVLLLRSVSYAGNVVSGTKPYACATFEYKKRTDIAYNISFLDVPRLLTYRLENVAIFAGGVAPCSADEAHLFQRYTLDYEISGDSGKSRLISISTHGKNNSKFPVATHYRYTDNSLGAPTTTPPPLLPVADQYGAPTKFARLSKLQVAYADLNGDGVNDVCLFGPNEGNQDFFHECLRSDKDGVRKKVNAPISSQQLRLAGGELPYIVSIFYPDLNADGRSDICALADNASLGIALTCWLTTDAGFSDRISTPAFWKRPDFRAPIDVEYFGSRFLSTIKFPDLNGDGAADLCWRNENGLHCFLTNVDNGGLSFSEIKTLPHVYSEGEFKAKRGEYSLENYHDGSDNDRYFQSIQFVDVDGDGADDICGRSVSGVACYVNDGMKFDKVFEGPKWVDGTKPEDGPDAASSSYYTRDTDWKRPSHWRTIRFADINGDGRPDVCGRDRQGIVCHLNDGERLAGAEIRGPSWASAGEYDYVPKDESGKSVGTMGDHVKPSLETDWTDPKHYTSLTVIDIDGDGLADICGRDAHGLLCFRGAGEGFAADPFVKFDPSAGQRGETESQFSLVDIDGDGRPEVCVSLKDGLTCWNLNSSPVPSDLLKSVETGYGTTESVEYSLASKQEDTRVPYPDFVVSRIKTTIAAPTKIDAQGSAAWSVRDHSQAFEYSGGFYYKRGAEFRGFSKVRVTDEIDGHRAGATETRFNQGHNSILVTDDHQTSVVADLLGRPAVITKYDDANAAWHRTETDYRASVKEPFFSPISEIRSVDCEPTRCEVAPMRIDFTYDEVGNTVQEVHFGSPADPADDFVIRRAFLTDKKLWLLGLPRRETTYAGSLAQRKVAETVTYYDDVWTCDGLEKGDAPQGPLRFGKPTRIVRWSGVGANVTSYFGYTSVGNLGCLVTPLGGIWRYGYDKETESLLVHTENAVHATLDQSYYGIDGVGLDGGNFGQLAREVDANKQLLQFTYDEFNRPTFQSFPDGAQIRIGYEHVEDAQARAIRTVDQSGSVHRTFLDGGLVPWKEESSGFHGQIISAFSIRDGNGRVISSSVPQYSDVGPKAWEVVKYDALGRVSKRTLANGGELDYCFGIRSVTSVNSIGLIERLTTDYFGRTLSRETFVSDEVSRPECTVAGGAPSSRMKYSYDELGRLTALSENDTTVMSVKYNALSQRIEVSDWDSGKTSLSYDGLGNVTRSSRPGKPDSFMTYDALGRIIQRDYGRKKPIGSGDEVFDYDAGELGKGRLSGARNRDFALSYSYDGVGRVLSIDQVGMQRKYSLNFTYEFGLLSSVTYPDQSQVLYSYNHGILESVSDKNLKLYARFVAYGASGLPTDYVLGERARVRTRLFDGTDAACDDKGGQPCVEVISPVAGKNDVVLVERWFAYDQAGRLTTVTDKSDPDRSFAASYDKFSSLTSFDSPTRKIEFEYDSNERLRAIRDKAGSRWLNYTDVGRRPANGLKSSGGLAFSYNEVGELREQLQLDDRGNSLPASRTQFEFDPSGRLKGVKGYQLDEEYYYDAGGRRVTRRSKTQEEFNFAGYFDCFYDRASGADCTRIVRAGSLMLALVPDGQKPIFRVSSAGGDLVTLVNATESPPVFLRQEPYGGGAKQQMHKDRAASTIGFHEAYFDPTTSLYYLGARFYDPVSTRFLSPDPIVANISSPLDLDRYSYGRNNPLGASDDNGQFPVLVVAAAVFGALMAGSQSDWDLGAMLKGALIGAASAYVGGLAAGAAGTAGGSVFGAAVGGAAAGGTSAIFTGQDPFRAAAIGFVSGGAGDYVSAATAPVLGAAAAGYTGAALYGDNPAEGIRWGIYGAMVSQLVITNIKSDQETLLGENGRKPHEQIDRSSVYALSPSGFSRFWSMLLGDPYSHVFMVDGDGQVYEATLGRDAGRVALDDFDRVYAGRQATRVGGLQVGFAASLNSTVAGAHPYGIGGDKLVCTQFVSAASGGQYHGFLPGQMYYGANGSAVASTYFWTRPPTH